jgi:hypothetical protein
VVLLGVLGFAAFGVAHLWRRGRRWLPCVLALWGGLPTLVALACAFVDAGMHPRYVTFAVPAFAIAATVGVFALPRWTPAVVGVAALVAVTPVLVAQRGLHAKPDDLRQVAATAADERPDAVYFTAPRARSVVTAYPDAFDDIDDLSAPLDPAPVPFFPGTRDPSTIEPTDVAGLRILVYGTRSDRSADRLRDLDCRSEPVTSDRHFVVTLYTCPQPD